MPLIIGKDLAAGRYPFFPTLSPIIENKFKKSSKEHTISLYNTLKNREKMEFKNYIKENDYDYDFVFLNDKIYFDKKHDNNNEARKNFVILLNAYLITK